MFLQYFLSTHVMCRCGYLVETSCSFDCSDSWIELNGRGLQKEIQQFVHVIQKDKLANGISGLDRHACKFYDSFDQWWHQTGTVMKHVTASANDSMNVEESTMDIQKDQNSNDIPMSTTTLAIKVDKKKFQKQCYSIFVQMAENSSVMVKNFEKTNALLKKVERQMDRLIDKL